MSEAMTSDPAAHECQLWTEERNAYAKRGAAEGGGAMKLGTGEKNG